VSRQTRDQLAEEARRRGQSLSSTVADMARQAEREAAFASEREATRRDAANPEAMAELCLWEATLEDGVD
jgi:macrodomain Ter protein organizer (MatP/YcbG family)